MTRKRGPTPEDPELPLEGDASEARASSGAEGPEEPEGAEEPEDDGTSSEPEQSETDRFFEEARDLAREGREEGAASLYRKILARDPGHVRARNNLGVLMDQSGNHEVALEHFRASLEHDPDNPEILTNLGAALGALGRYEEAERELRRALRLEPGRVDVRANLGILHFRRGLYAQAEGELRWVCEQEPDHGPAHFYRGEALNRLGRVDQALETLERASHLQPGNPRIFYLMGILYDKKHLSEEAGIMYRRARELSGR